MTRPGTARTVHLHVGPCFLLLALPDLGMPLVLGWGQAPLGRPTQATGALALTSLRRNGMDDPVPEAVLLPTGALGRFGWPALQGHREGRDWTLQFGAWRAEEGPGTLLLHGRDEVAGLALTIRLGLSDAGVWTMASALTNQGDAIFALDRCMAGTVLVDAGLDRLVTYEGGWGREFHLAEQRLGTGVWLQESRRGRTSHDRMPTLFLAGNAGPFGAAPPCVGAHLGWSGNHAVAVDPLEDGRRLLHLGELFEPGEMRLEPGDTYESPTIFFTGGPDLDAVAAHFRTHLRRHVLRWPGGAPTPRPVTLNTWEGSYFDHDPENLMRQASAAAALGVERFVLDDGWFGHRDDDASSLGDWVVDARKYPDGLGPLVRHVTGLGMQFGLWFEPEMVSPDSDLYRAHPDWALRVEGRPLLLSRDQAVLDLSRAEAFDHVFGQMHAVLAAHAVSSIKWDMNRDLAGAGGADGRAATARQTRAVYALMDRIRAAHPTVEIESCASGGGRVDFGALARTHRVWLSDGTDALDRLAIQAGAALVLPPEIVGCHVSASPNHVTGRRHTLAFRAIVAMAGHFGVELNPLALAPAETDELEGWITLHKRLRPLLHGPDSTLFRHPVRDGRHVYGALGADRAVIFVAQAGHPLRYRADAVRVAGADPGRRWRVAAVHPKAPPFARITPEQAAVLAGEVAFGAFDLAAVGLPVPALPPESALILELEALASPHG